MRLCTYMCIYIYIISSSNVDYNCSSRSAAKDFSQAKNTKGHTEANIYSKTIDRRAPN